MPAKPVSAVVFDLDGVLVDSLEVMALAFRAAYAEIVDDRVEAPFQEYLTHLGRHLPDILAIMGLPAQMHPAFVRHSAALLHRIPMCTGADRLLCDLRGNGLALAVATGKSRDRAEAALAAVGLLDSLDTVCGSDEVGNGKPAPDIVLLALERLGADADEAVMVGDSVLDLKSGRAAGTRTAAALWGQGSVAELRACAPDLVGETCDDLRRQLCALVGVRS
jgi:AHBA synthesis associated protein